MNYTQFISKHVGKAMDYDGVAGVQCVDLIKYYLDEVFGVKPGAWGDAHCYYDNFNNIPQLKKNFERIPNTPAFVPAKGDIMVWSRNLNGGWGHIAICTGTGSTTYFNSHDQNWTGRHDACKLVRHSYNCVLGVLRPKDQSKITTPTKPADKTPFTTGLYRTTVDLKVRTGPGTNYRQKNYSELTANAKQHAYYKLDKGVLKSGTAVTVSLVSRKSSKEYWGKIPSGYIALMYKGKTYVKK